jgi:CheY-like chemotaxis protein
VSPRERSAVHILIVDDNPDVGCLLGDALSRAGYAVQTAINGEEALLLFAATRPAAVLLDLHMPAMGGVEVFAKLRQMDATVPIVIVTADSDEECARILLREGAFDYVRKPVDLHHLSVVLGAATGQVWPTAFERAFGRAREEAPALTKGAYAVMGLSRRLDGPAPHRQALEEAAHEALRGALLGDARLAVERLSGIARLLTDGRLAWLRPADADALRAELHRLRAFLPRAAEPTEASPTSGGELAGVRVLVVDDTPDALDLISVMLEQSGATVLAARSADEAVTVFRREAIDVLVSDIAMPGHDGYWLVERLRRAGDARPRPLIALAVSGVVRDAGPHALAAGFDDFMPKPIEPDELCQRVAQLVTA